MDNFNRHPNRVLVVMAGGMLLACTNPAPGGGVSASSADSLDTGFVRSEPTACQVAERPSAALPAHARGLYEHSVVQAEPPATATRDYSGDNAGCVDSLTGSYAIQLELDVYSQEDQSTVTAQFDPTRDRATLLLRADLGEQNGQTRATLRLCGLDLPTRYAYATSTATQLLVPDAAWDRPDMPTWTSRVQPATSRLQLDPFPVLLGIALPEPGAAWPSYEQTPKLECGAGQRGISCFPDQDMDGKPGLTLVARSGAEVRDAPYPACHSWSYAAPSTHPEPWLSGDSEGASHLFVGLRTALQLFLDIDEGCAPGGGSVIAEDIQTRVFDCEVTDGQRCTPYQATVADARAPSFHVLAKREMPAPGFHDSRAFIDEALDRVPSDGGKVSVRRIAPASASACAAVRAAFGS